MSSDIEIFVNNLIDGSIKVEPSFLSKFLSCASDAFFNNDGEEIDIPIIKNNTEHIISIIREPFLTDEEFDFLENKLKLIDPKNLYFSKIGSTTRGGKIKLPHPMGSLDQLNNDDTVKWISSNNLTHEEIPVTDKLDGVSGLLVYDNYGKLSIAYSRGNGLEGADITRHIKKIKSVPKKISGPMITRVEIIIPKEKFNFIRQDILYRTGKDYKNPRNFTSGQMNSEIAEDIFYENAKVIATSVIEPEMSKIEQFEKCNNEGIETTYYSVFIGKDIDDETLMKYFEERKSISDYEIDGIVLDVNDLLIRKSMKWRESSLNPPYSKKFKLHTKNNTVETVVEDVLWAASKDGILKPRIRVKPVNISGATITYTTGFNAKFIVDNNIGSGAKVLVSRRGDVISHIEKIIEGSSHTILPSIDEVGEYDWNETGVDFALKNPDKSFEARLNKLSLIFSKLDIPALRKTSIEKIMKSGYDTAPNIIKMNEEEFKNIIGNIVGTKIYHGLKEKLNPISIEKLAGASQTLGRGVGETKLKKIVREYGRLLDLTFQEILQVEGFDVKTATLLYNNMRKFNNFLEEIEGYYTFDIVRNNNQIIKNDIHVVFTGIRDKNMEEKIEGIGGKVLKTISSNVTHLVVKDLTGKKSTKLKKAEELGIKIITIDEAKKLWT